jgi:hypothetical protein
VDIRTWLAKDHTARVRYGIDQASEYKNRRKSLPPRSIANAAPDTAPVTPPGIGLATGISAAAVAPMAPAVPPSLPPSQSPPPPPATHPPLPPSQSQSPKTITADMSDRISKVRDVDVLSAFIAEYLDSYEAEKLSLFVAKLLEKKIMIKETYKLPDGDDGPIDYWEKAYAAAKSSEWANVLSALR